MKKKSKEIALAGMLSALAVVILFLGSMIELLDLSAAALAALVVMVLGGTVGIGLLVWNYKKIEMKMQADIYLLGLRVLYEAGECCMAKMTEKHG